VIEFAERSRETLVFPRAETASSTEEIMGDNGIRALDSSEVMVMAVWEAA
jgi:hypothetical protein